MDLDRVAGLKGIFGLGIILLIYVVDATPGSTYEARTSDAKRPSVKDAAILCLRHHPCVPYLVGTPRNMAGVSAGKPPEALRSGEAASKETHT